MEFLIFYLILFFWFLALTKKFLFWLWLWQIKEYRLERFIDHFRTEKGKKLINNYLNFTKFFSVFGLIFIFPIFLIILFFLYLAEFFLTLRHFIKKTFKYPVLTQKTFIILAIGFLGQILILISLFHFFEPGSLEFLVSLLIIDILSPLIFSLFILCFQPITILLARRIIKRAREKRDSFKNLKVIGITGSYGKTSTKEFLFVILSSCFNVLKTEKHHNTDMAIAQTILKDLKPEHQVFICEMAAYEKGGIRSAAVLAKPNFGILLGTNEQHLALFGSMENLISAEGGKELIDSLSEDSSAIILDRRKDLKINHLKSQIFCSVKEKLDFWAEDIKVEKESVSFNLNTKDGERALFKLNLIGAQNVENILLTVACAKELGMNLKEIVHASEKIKPLDKTMEPKKGINGLLIIDDSYSANPDGVVSALDYLKIYEQKKIIIMPCLIELGKASKQVHQRIGRKIAEICDLAIITTKEHFLDIKQAAIRKGLKEKNILFMENSKEILKKIKSFCNSGDVILLEGRISEDIINQLIEIRSL